MVKNINDYITRINTGYQGQALKHHNNKVYMLSYRFKKVMNHSKAIKFLDTFIRRARDLKNKVYQIALIYDNIVVYNITDGFVKLPTNVALKDITYSFFDYYGRKVRERVRDRVTGFDIFYTKKAPTDGGNDINKMNDCLYYSLKDVLSPSKLKLDCMENPSTFKKKLNLERRDKIDIKLIPKIEKMLSVNIVVSGDYSYIPADTYSSKVNIKLVNGHYTSSLNKLYKTLNLMNGVYKKEKPIQVFKPYQEKYIFYNGEETYTSDKFNKEYLSVKVSDDLEEGYIKTLEEYNEMKELSDGKYNPFMFQDIPKMALYYFYQYFKDITPDPITPEEALILKRATMGGTRYAEKGTFDNVYDYDFNRFYPYLQITKLQLPTTKPQFIKLDKLPDKIKLGIYKANITFDGETPYLFRKNNYDLYTNYDIVMIRDMGANIELIDDEWNVMSYDSYCSMSRLKAFYNELYELSCKSKFKLFKYLMNCLWGKLCSKNKKLIDNTKEEVQLDTYDIIQRKSIDCNYIQITKIDMENLYMYPFGRLTPFILSKGRYYLYYRIKDHMDDIVYIHTDGFISKKKIEDLTVGDKMGLFKVQKYSKAVIHNKNSKDLTL